MQTNTRFQSRRVSTPTKIGSLIFLTSLPAHLVVSFHILCDGGNNAYLKFHSSWFRRITGRKGPPNASWSDAPWKAPTLYRERGSGLGTMKIQSWYPCAAPNCFIRWRGIRFAQIIGIDRRFFSWTSADLVHGCWDDTWGVWWKPIEPFVSFCDCNGNCIFWSVKDSFLYKWKLQHSFWRTRYATPQNRMVIVRVASCFSQN